MLLNITVEKNEAIKHHVFAFMRNSQALGLQIPGWEMPRDLVVEAGKDEIYLEGILVIGTHRLLGSFYLR